jgi:hypothetical protein
MISIIQWPWCNGTPGAAQPVVHFGNRRVFVAEDTCHLKRYLGSFLESP